MPDSHDAPAAHGDPWGPYRESIQEAVDQCADYLDRLQRSLRGEIAPDRPYFHEKAAYLQDAATTLARRAQDVERWIGECGTQVRVREEGEIYLDTCTLPADHANPLHRPNGHNTATLDATDRARYVAGRFDHISRRLAHLGPEIDHRHRANHHDIPDQRADIQELKTDVDQLIRQSTTLSRTLTATDQTLALDHQLATRQPPGPEPLGR